MPQKTATFPTFFSGTMKSVTTAVQDLNDVNNNVFIGRESGSSSSDADRNIGIGYQPLQNTTGNDNIAMGLYSMNRCVDAGQNVCIGQSTGLRLVTGDNNVFVGARAHPASR